MTDPQADTAAIGELERRRYAALLAADWDGFAAVCHPQLRYTHSTGVTDTLETYLAACRSGFYRYHRLEHPVAATVVTADVGLVFGEMNGEITAGGVAKRLGSTTLAVWVRSGQGWRLIAFQATPRG